MIVYNITTNVSSAIHNEWLKWMREEYIPQILQTGCFFESRILRLLEIDDDEGPTYAIQFHAPSREDYQAYMMLHAEYINQYVREKWGDQIVNFGSVMEVLH